MDPNIPDRIKLAIWFAVTGDLRYLSHHDTMRGWRRILVRAGLLLRYSQGFNPHIRLSLPLPRSVAMAAHDELLLVELTETPDLEVAAEGIRQQLPVGMSLSGAQLVPTDVSTQPQGAAYQLELPSDIDRAKLQHRLAEFQAADQWPIMRPRRRRHPARTIDLRDCLTDLAVAPDHLTFRVNITAEATPRIDEILSALHLDRLHLASYVTRTKTYYSNELTTDN